MLAVPRHLPSFRYTILYILYILKDGFHTAREIERTKYKMSTTYYVYAHRIGPFGRAYGVPRLYETEGAIRY